MEEPLGTVRATRPETVGTSILSPSTASSMVIGSSITISSPWRTNRGCGLMMSSISASPAGPPPIPGPPLPFSRRTCPSVAPSGMVRSSAPPSGRVMRCLPPRTASRKSTSSRYCTFWPRILADRAPPPPRPNRSAKRSEASPKSSNPAEEWYCRAPPASAYSR